MGRYTLKDGKLKSAKTQVRELELIKSANGLDKKAKAVPYVKMQRATKTAGYAYLYLGSAGQLMLSSTVPTGTTGSFTNIGGRIGTTG